MQGSATSNHTSRPRTMVLGLGNTILTDDGVGIYIIRKAAGSYRADNDVAFAEACVGGLRLLEYIVGYERLVIVDAIQTGGRPGQCYLLRPRDIQTTLHANSSHDLSLPEVFALGRALELPLPPEEDVVILAVEVQDVDTFGEGCTDGVEAAIPAVASKLLEEVLATRDKSCMSVQQASCSAEPARPWGTRRANASWNTRTTLCRERH